MPFVLFTTSEDRKYGVCDGSNIRLVIDDLKPLVLLNSVDQSHIMH